MPSFAHVATVCLAAASTVLAQSATSTATAAGTTHTVIVGAGAQRQYSPNDTTAAVGDFVTFIFGGANHTVTQSTFANPCSPIPQNTTTQAVGFDSGFVPANATNMSAFTIQVTEAKPLWFYCAQGTHCKAGMVGSINAPATGNTYAAYLNNALNSQPGVVVAGTGASGAATTAAVAGSTGGAVGGTLSGSSGAPAAAASPTGSASRHTVAIGSAALLSVASLMLLA